MASRSKQIVRTDTHIAFILKHDGTTIVEIYAKVWPQGIKRKDNSYSLSDRIMMYETSSKGATTSAKRELRRLASK